MGRLPWISRRVTRNGQIHSRPRRLGLGAFVGLTFYISSLMAYVPSSLCAHGGAPPISAPRTARPAQAALPLRLRRAAAGSLGRPRRAAAAGSSSGRALARRPHRRRTGCPTAAAPVPFPPVMLTPESRTRPPAGARDARRHGRHIALLGSPGLARRGRAKGRDAIGGDHEQITSGATHPHPRRELQK
jgi:hypothetical protein